MGLIVHPAWMVIRVAPRTAGWRRRPSSPLLYRRPVAQRCRTACYFRTGVRLIRAATAHRAPAELPAEPLNLGRSFKEALTRVDSVLRPDGTG